ncbi:MAG: NUDIX hydrolase [Magnetococcales bacterium]|nr:NUDIX hydrolase [Magnetococcales bacterium]
MREHPDYYYNQSAVIPFRKGQGGRLEILLITSRKKKRWVIPKGIAEPNMTPADSAAKEALEEAGIKGDVLPGVIGDYAYQKWGGTCAVKVYVMRVTEELKVWAEDFRDREWLPLEEAAKRMEEPSLAKMMRNTSAFLSSAE